MVDLQLVFVDELRLAACSRGGGGMRLLLGWCAWLLLLFWELLGVETLIGEVVDDCWVLDCLTRRWY